MGWADEEDTRTYRVVINHEEQYSIWFADREVPLGWKDIGKKGTKQECLKYIAEVWTDMRPSALEKCGQRSERKKSDWGGKAPAHRCLARRLAVSRSTRT